jgi:hypothetical protein
VTPSRYMVRLHGGSFDGHHCEVVFPPRAIVVCIENGEIIVADLDDNPPPLPEGWRVYRQLDVHGSIADYGYQAVQRSEAA